MRELAAHSSKFKVELLLLTESSNHWPPVQRTHKNPLSFF